MFFSAPNLQSQIKSAIASKYFTAWPSILSHTSRKLGYIDLFSGPGKYDDGKESTPILVMRQVLANPTFRSKVEALFCDENHNHVDKLKTQLSALPGYNDLGFEPQYYKQTFDQGLAEKVATLNYPCFLFIDPFGYKGLAINIINKALKQFGTHCTFTLAFTRNEREEAEYQEEHI